MLIGDELSLEKETMLIWDELSLENRTKKFQKFKKIEWIHLHSENSKLNLKKKVYVLLGMFASHVLPLSFIRVWDWEAPRGVSRRSLHLLIPHKHPFRKMASF